MHKLQIIVPFFIAGLGTCFAGIILDHVQFWEVFSRVDELFIVLPALLGLKGNLQMTLASRFSTHSHLGHLQTREALLSLTCANLALNQFFSTIISLSACLLAVFIRFLTNGQVDGQSVLLVSSTALLTSSTTSFLLDILMIMVVQASSIMQINPDNVATPIAASLGDMTSLVLTAFLANNFYLSRNTLSFYWTTSCVILLFLLLLPVWAFVANENVYTSGILNSGIYWYPLITAMAISSFSGIILKSTVGKSEDIALFQPVICGSGGNLVAVQASRLSTHLHRNDLIGNLPEGETICFNPIHMLTSSKPNFTLTRTLLALVVPGQTLFYLVCVFVNDKRPIAQPSLTFLITYLAACQLHVFLLLYLAHIFTYAFWSNRTDPDNVTIPYLTSISDALGAVAVTLICLLVVPNELRSSAKLPTNWAPQRLSPFFL